MALSYDNRNRPRAKSNASARAITRPRANSHLSSADENDTKNRSRSQSNASISKGSRRILGGFGLGKKASEFASGKKKIPDSDPARQALQSETDDEEEELRTPLDLSDTVQTRTRSHSNLSASTSDPYRVKTPPIRRTQTAGNAANERWVKALYDFPGDASDELALRVGQVVQVTKEVSSDWWIGESNGQTGMFPATYVEEHIPTPTTATYARPVPARPRASTASRVLPPIAAPAQTRNQYADTSDSEHSHFSDAEQHTTASLAAGGRAPSSYISTTPKKAAPPPPPSRRSRSQSNILSSSTSSVSLAPPLPNYARKKNGSSTGSPFAGSEEDEDDEIFGGRR